MIQAERGQLAALERQRIARALVWELVQGAAPVRPPSGEILRLMTSGLSNRVMGQRTHLSENTAKSHVHESLGNVAVLSWLKRRSSHQRGAGVIGREPVDPRVRGNRDE